MKSWFDWNISACWQFYKQRITLASLQQCSGVQQKQRCSRAYDSLQKLTLTLACGLHLYANFTSWDGEKGFNSKYGLCLTVVVNMELSLKLNSLFTCWSISVCVLTLTYRLQLCVLCDIKAATINIFILTVDQKAMCMLALYREVHLFQHLSAHSCGVWVSD